MRSSGAGLGTPTTFQSLLLLPPASTAGGGGAKFSGGSVRTGVGFSGDGVAFTVGGGGVRAGGGFIGDGVGFSGGGVDLLESGGGDSERGFSGGLDFVVVMDTLPVVELKVERLTGGGGSGEGERLGVPGRISRGEAAGGRCGSKPAKDKSSC